MYGGRKKEDENKNKNSYGSVNDNRNREGKRKNDYNVLSNKEENMMKNEKYKIESENENENENENEKVFDHFPSFDSVNGINENPTNEFNVLTTTECRRKNRASISEIKGSRSPGSGDSVSESIGTK